MRNITFGVSSRSEFGMHFTKAIKGKKQGSYLTFASIDLLFSTLTESRWNIIRALLGGPALTISELVDRLDVDPQKLTSDVEALLHAGVLDGYDEGLIDFPYSEVHVNFCLTPPRATKAVLKQKMAIGRHAYVPDPMHADEAKVMLKRLADLIPKVDHGFARRWINEVTSELLCEIDNIEQGYRGPEYG